MSNTSKDDAQPKNRLFWLFNFICNTKLVGKWLIEEIVSEREIDRDRYIDRERERGNKNKWPISLLSCVSWHNHFFEFIIHVMISFPVLFQFKNF